MHGLDVSLGDGLEFGPLCRPILRRPDARIFYVDHIDRDDLVQQYARDRNVDTTTIVPVDVVWEAGSLRGAVETWLRGPQRWFAYAIASHVIEHVPDIIWWLAELRSVMSSGAALRLIIPDRRFTMDIDRRESQLCDALGAYLLNARQPQPREIVDFYHRFRVVDAARAWQSAVLPGAGDAGQARRGMGLAYSATHGSYHDVHCWVFTPSSFVRLMVELAELGLIWFSCARLYATAEGELDFFVHMSAADDAAKILQSWRAAEAELAAGTSGAWLPQEGADVLRAVVRRQSVQIETLTRELARRDAVPITWARVVGKIRRVVRKSGDWG